MPPEQILIYLLVGGFALLQFIAGALKRRRQEQLEQQSGPAPPASEPDEEWWNPVPEPAPRAVRVEATPPPSVMRPVAAERSDARPSPRQRPRQLPQPARAEPGSHHRAALRDRAQLRRAIELMAILGPPRSRAADDS
jgi:hypothetical protein